MHNVIRIVGQMVVEGSTTLHYKGTDFSRIHMGAFAQASASTKDDFMQVHFKKCLFCILVLLLPTKFMFVLILFAVFVDTKTNTRCSEYSVLAVHTCTKGLKFHIILNRWPDHDRYDYSIIRGANSGEIPEEDKNKYVMESDQVETEEPRKTLTRSNYASKYYHYKRKHLVPSKSNSDLEIYKSLLAEFREDAKILKVRQKKKVMVMQYDKGSEPAENFKGTTKTISYARLCSYSGPKSYSGQGAIYDI
ncbi:hypothetical protein Hanom_Chr04g00371671 [Helianthus anomalus]